MRNWHWTTLLINIDTWMRLKEVICESYQMFCPADSSISVLHHMRQMLG